MMAAFDVRYVCLLRGINVGGQRLLTMPALMDMCAELGFGDAGSYLQSGNLIFSSRLGAAQIEALIENGIRTRFGYPDVTALAWTGAALAAAIRDIPADWKGHDAAQLHFTFLKRPVQAAPADADAYLPDRFVIGQQVAYVYCPNGYGRTQLNNGFFERLLNTRATTRNWNTVNKLLERVNA